MLTRLLERGRVIRLEDYDFAEARALRKAIAFFFAIVAFAKLFVAGVLAAAQLAAEDLVHQQRVAKPRFHVGASESRFLQRFVELLLACQSVLLFEALHRVPRLVAGNRKIQ